MSSKYDAIVIGGGHNGSYGLLLAKEVEVLVLERRTSSRRCVTEEAFPGYKVSTAAYVNSLFRRRSPDLHLKDYGFEAIERNPRRSRRSWTDGI